ncbi:DHA1 family multidrug resistance protein-like MFS transporter [Paenibacillus sp. V4I3]|uniref:MFS transporter n=1 Tax=Paenibacillus germinis TaxID=2654979 RepID=A0ABX1YZA5_9BACL|nr:MULTISPECIES: MFS transporter [Paenibacillus]MDQ0876705.1 DHA1 family multidrug resistance protein-like MFS transporter [Paenibacillus sp. V4I3]MDQ0887354.1 DHA1 family multidrug resistance protein-like MFS transporter [Paenibacillus sp. V4I9]NOU85043.1 MFS transporter [Paenibacillus germinis]
MNKQIGIIMLLLMTIFVGFGIIIPVLPEVVKGAGAEYHNALLLSVYSAASFLMSPIWGGLSDRIGRRPIILIGLLGFSVSFLIFGFADGNLWIMYVSRILGGLFSGAATACAVAYVADITTAENRTKGMGMVGMSIGLGFIFGPAIGGILSRWGTYLPFFVASGLALASFVFAFAILKESLSVDKRTSVKEKAPSRWTAFAGASKYLYVLSFFVSFTLAGLEATLQYYQMDKIGATPFDIGMMFLASGIVGALIQGGVVRRLVKQGAEQRVIGIGLLLSAAGFFLLLYSSSVVTAAIYLSVFGAGNALIRPCVTSLITQRTKVGQGVATGLSSSMDSLGRIAGPLLGGAVFAIAHSLPFIIGGVLCLAAILLLQRFVLVDRQTRAQQQTA